MLTSAVVLVAAVGVSNLYVQGGLRLQQVAWFTVFLAGYDLIFSTVIPLTPKLGGHSSSSGRRPWPSPPGSTAAAPSARPGTGCGSRPVAPSPRRLVGRGPPPGLAPSCGPQIPPSLPQGWEQGGETVGPGAGPAAGRVCGTPSGVHRRPRHDRHEPNSSSRPRRARSRLGERITFSYSSGRSLHVIVPGRDAQPRSQPGTPSLAGASGHRAEVGGRWTTAPWNVPGTYWVTCTLHPTMNLEVVVTAP